MNFLSLVDASLGQSEIFGIALTSVAYLGVGWRGGFSSHKVFTRPLKQMASSHEWDFCFTSYTVQKLVLSDK